MNKFEKWIIALLIIIILLLALPELIKLIFLIWGTTISGYAPMF